ncbi:hypothetical protein BDZ97DRAFT_2027891 [Flammula alnicola]|nr:hypothetical protein BDZ97DRAFT_2027891 [Flammula alnicola]
MSLGAKRPDWTGLQNTTRPQPTTMSHHCPFCGSMENQGVYDNDSLCSKFSNLNLCDPCKRLAELEIQIIKARESLLEMQREARRLKSEMNYSRHHLLIHQLPPKILSNIFQLCIPHEMSSNSRRAPFALSCVCQKWQQIAHTTPQLWTTIFFSLGHHSNLSESHWAQVWIDRSAQLPLSIGLVIKSSVANSWDYTVNLDVIAVINRCSSRWQDLTYEGPSSSLSYLVGDSQGASQLQTLKLDVYVTWQYKGQFKLGDFKPTPTTLKITYIDLKSVVIEWNNITHVQGCCISLDDCWELFRITPRMTHCQLQDVLHLQDSFSRPHTPILHPTLQVLELSIASNAFHCFRDNVSLPSLQSFSYTSNRRDVRDDYLEIETAISLFVRSSCSLQMLALLCMKLDIADLVDLSRVMPGLHHLELALSSTGHAAAMERIFRGFSTDSTASIVTDIDTETEQVIFPQLQSMKIEGTMPLDWKLVPDIFGSPPMYTIFADGLCALLLFVKSNVPQKPTLL